MAVWQRFLGEFMCVLSRPGNKTVMLTPTLTCKFTTKQTQGTDKQMELAVRASFLADTFGTSKKKMETFLSSNVHIVSMNHDKFKKCSYLLRDYGLNEQDIVRNAEVFNCSVSKINTRLKELQREGLDISLSLVTLSANKFKDRMARLMIDSRIEHEYESHEVLLIKLLNCSQQKAKSVMTEHKWLRKSKLITLKANIETIKNYGVSNEAIVERLFIIVVSQDILAYQLSTLRKNGIFFSDYRSSFLSFIQPQKRKFEKSLARVLAEKKILQESKCENKKEYLCSRLTCTEKDLNVMTKQFRNLMSVNLPKLKQNLDFLLHTCQMSSYDIISNALMLGFSYSTLSERYEQLQALDVAVNPVQLKMSKSRFEAFVNRLSENQN